MQLQGDSSQSHPPGEHSRLWEDKGTVTSLGSVLLLSDCPDGQQVTTVKQIHGKRLSLTRKFLQFLALNCQFPISTLDLISFFHEGSKDGIFLLLLSFLFLICLQVKTYGQWCITALLAQESCIIKIYKMPQIYASVTLFSAPTELCLIQSTV